MDFFFSLFIFIFLNMKPLSLEMACLLGTHACRHVDGGISPHQVSTRSRGGQIMPTIYCCPHQVFKATGDTSSVPLPTKTNLMSVSIKSIVSAVVFYFCTCYTFFRNGCYNPGILFNKGYHISYQI